MRQKCFLFLFLFCLMLPALVWSAQKEILSGTVQFTKVEGKYTYIQLQQAGKEVWVAASDFDVTVGDEIEYAGGVQMYDFHTKALDRTFDEILFLTNIRKKPEAKSILQSEMPNDDNHRNLVSAQPVVAAPAPGEVVKSEAELSIAQLFAQRSAMAGKVVSVRGKVLKVSNNILGKTWVTLSDGTGTAPDDKLLVTTLQEIEIGATLSATGKVKTNIDLGMGYAYKVVLEDANFSR